MIFVDLCSQFLWPSYFLQFPNRWGTFFASFLCVKKLFHILFFLCVCFKIIPLSFYFGLKIILQLCTPPPEYPVLSETCLSYYFTILHMENCTINSLANTVLNVPSPALCCHLNCGNNGLALGTEL